MAGVACGQARRVRTRPVLVLMPVWMVVRPVCGSVTAGGLACQEWRRPGRYHRFAVHSITKRRSSSEAAGLSHSLEHILMSPRGHHDSPSLQRILRMGMITRRAAL